MEQKYALPDLTPDNFSKFSDRELIHVLKEMIYDAIIKNRVYLDDDDIANSVEVIYPTLFNVVFNSNYGLRHNEKEVYNLVNYLVVNLA